MDAAGRISRKYESPTANRPFDRCTRRPALSRLIPMNTAHPVAVLLATGAQQAEKTVRSPLLYAWLTVQVLFLLLVCYGAYRLVRKWAVSRRDRD